MDFGTPNHSKLCLLLYLLLVPLLFMSEKSKISMELCHKLSKKPVHPQRCVHCTFNYKEARPPRNFPMPGVKERNEALCK